MQVVQQTRGPSRHLLLWILALLWPEPVSQRTQRMAVLPKEKTVQRSQLQGQRMLIHAEEQRHPQSQKNSMAGQG